MFIIILRGTGDDISYMLIYTYVSHDNDWVGLGSLLRALNKVDHSHAECCVSCTSQSETTSYMIKC